MQSVFVHFSNSPRKISWPKECGNPATILRLIHDACELAPDMTIRVIDSFGRNVKPEDILSGSIEHLYVEMDEEETVVFYPTTQTFLEILAAPAVLLGNKSGYERIPDRDAEDFNSEKDISSLQQCESIDQQSNFNPTTPASRISSIHAANDVH